MTITERVAQKMREEDITQVELAQALGITKSTMNYILNNGKTFDADSVLQLAEKLGVSVSWLLTGDDNRIGVREIVKEVRPELPEDEMELLNIYRSLDREGRTCIFYEAYKQRGRHKAKLQEEEEPVFFDRTA